MSLKPMTIKAFAKAVKKIAAGRTYLVQVDSFARLQSDGSGMTVVMYYGWIEGHRACSDISAEAVLQWLSKTQGDKSPVLRQV